MANKAGRVTIDLTNYKDKVGSRVPPGTYRVVVEDAEVDQSKAGNPMINLWFRIVGGDVDGSTIVDRLVMTEKSLFRAVGFMQALGLPTPKRRLQVNIATWVGKQLEIDVEDGEPYNGKVKSEVRGYNRIPKTAAKTEVEGQDELAGLEEFKPKASGEETVATSDADVPDEVDLDDLNL